MIRLTGHDPFNPTRPTWPVWFAWYAIGVVQVDWANGTGAIVQMPGDDHMHRVRESAGQVLDMRELARKREAP